MNKIKYFEVRNKTVSFSLTYEENSDGDLKPAIVFHSDKDDENANSLIIFAKSETDAQEIFDKMQQKDAEFFAKFTASNDFKKIFERDCDEE